MQNSRYPDISINYNGETYVVEKIYVSELNYLMLRVYCEVKKKYTTFNLGQYDINNNFISNELHRAN